VGVTATNASTKTYVAEILGTTGSPVVLIPGGAAPSKRFFPHLEEELAGTHRVVLVDRQGTGRAVGLGPATLPSGSAAYAEVLRELGAGPALVVGQSLGGALALQLAVDHPDLVSGLVLIDPTPVNSPKTLRTLGPLVKILMGPCGLPVIGPRLEGFITRRTGKVADDPLVHEAIEAMVAGRALWWTTKAVGTLPAEGAALTQRLGKLGVPVVLLTADRKPTHEIRRAHEELVDAVGGSIVSWPGAVHAEHHRDPQKVTDLVLSALAEVEAR
jgi:pimeloyl-ACP methyl ester carboxylesterase